MRGMDERKEEREGSNNVREPVDLQNAETAKMCLNQHPSS